jgi:probable phosphoglycerate mutase
MTTVLLIRHGESQAHKGLPSLRPETVELTENGWQQAEDIARYLNKKAHPNLMVTSSFQRTKQTAQPTLALFPFVPREVWEVHEFTYLGLQHDILSTINERRVFVQNYWNRCKPFAVESPDSESFVLFIKRVKHLLFRLKATSYDTIAVFSHEQFICAFLWCLQRGWPNLTQDDMKDYREFLDANPIPNGGIVRVQFDDDYASWNYAMITSHLKTLTPCADSMRSVRNDEMINATD